MSTLRVFVTAKDIKNGRRGQAGGCPIALALKRLTGDELDWVGDSLVHIKGHTYDLPTEAKMFVNSYDHKGADAVRPSVFEFEIEE